ncbi:MAG: YiiD C-terminal domain-containing protein [Bacteroidetes bacterium]|nr:YiiD C-terminal domain-containing protein [Bacteroidota bacterium]MDA0903165.1 YiiD C-terminal domain-containing protein [Bacteroidota bacterium]MDA1242412.1 YiiD C-terminal domain-containing protein [Bacteroidota bacterium]
MKPTSAAIRLLNKQIEAAKSGRVTWISRLLQEVIPFNRPHRLRVVSLSDHSCTIALPFRRRNKNHLGTMHACAIATASEYAAGMCVLATLGVGGFRLIMSDLHVTYVRRGEMDCQATASFPEEVKQDMIRGLDLDGKAQFDMVSEVSDAKGQPVARAVVTWHIKRMGV